MNVRTRILLSSLLVALAGCGPSANSGQLVRPTPLHQAVIDQDVGAMQQLLRAGLDPRADDGAGRTPMTLAAECGSEEFAARFLLALPEIDLVDAARRGDQQAVALILAGDPDAPRRKYPGPWRNALAEAVQAGQTGTAALLMDRGLGLDKKEEHSWLHMAAWEGRTPVIRCLIDAGGTPQLPHSVLSSAAEAGHLEIVDLLLNAGVDVNGLGDNHASALQAAAWGGHLDVVRRLLLAGASVDIASKWGWRPIHSALWTGRQDIAQLLLDHGARVDVFVAAATGRIDDLRRLLREPLPLGFEKSYGPLPIIWAVRGGQIEVLKQFFDNPAALATRSTPEALPSPIPVPASPNGLTLLHIAAQAGQVETIRWLVSRGAALEATGTENFFGPYYQMTPLCAAAAAGKIAGAKALLDLGADIEATASRLAPNRGYAFNGSPPLVLAATEGHADMVAFLLDHGADINSEANKSIAALDMAAERGQLEVGRLLLKREARVDGRPPDNASLALSPLYRAANCGHLDIVKLLVAAGANVNIGANNPKWTETPLVAAARGNHADLVRYLLDHGARAEASSRLLSTALQSQDAETVRLVLAAGASVGTDPPDRDTIGVYAGLLGDVAVVKALIAKGWAFGPKDVSHFNHNDLNNIFSAAIYANHPDLVRFLLAKGFRVDASDDHGCLPLWFAAENGAKLSAIVLLDAGADPRGGDGRQTPRERAAKGRWPALVRLLEAAEARTRP